MKKTFYSNGKLLITGEYVVLDGAKALALPTKFGQDLQVEPTEKQEIHWTSFDKDGSIWFEDTFSFSAIENKTPFENEPIKSTLINILHEALHLNPDFFKLAIGYSVKTQLTFPRFWGLGTSSTLINNIAQWFQIDAFTLLRNSFGGSGYDIACAQNNTPILYQLVDGNPIVEPVTFLPEYSDQLYFVYLNHKQSSKNAIVSYYKKTNALGHIIPKIDAITAAILQKPDFKTLTSQLNLHEILMSSVLEQLTVKEHLFPDFKGTIKSLGAWGGDFVLVVAEENPEVYFKQKGYETILPYSEIIL
jgi:mevalonate kinase